jgi:quinohemoprotein ethanol dehydrogenase
VTITPFSRISGFGLIAAAALALGACGEKATTSDENAASTPPPAASTVGTGVETVDGQRIANADLEPGNWMTTGRTYSEQRFSPLKEINALNVSDLGIAWAHDLDTKRGQEATPIVVDGVMYTTEAWSKVLALNAKTGELIWQYDPQVRRRSARDACCDVVNRGPAVWKGKVYVGALDGRLIALDAKTGAVIWDVQTTDPDQPYTITGAPRVVKGKVIIGNGGAERSVRGYASAYDAETGKLVWRFYLTPGDPSKGFENPALEMAATTWHGEWWKAGGGGGNPWDGFAYDPDLDLLYIGGGNGGPFDRNVRSPGGGDNLFLGAIVAVRPDTGEYVWHFQETPGDSWDFTSVQQITLADLEIGGTVRKVLLHAPKNGFFYVLDRETGEFISGNNYVPVTWAKGLDENGRPIMNPDAWYMDAGKPFLGIPGPAGGHNWNPMSFDPETGLVYIPAQETPWTFFPNQSAVGPGGMQSAPKTATVGPKAPDWTGFLIAWDPIKQKEVWRVNHPGPSNGGTLATAGNLVFEGDINGGFHAYSADTGQELWSTDLQSAPMAGPVSYTVDGEQYVAVSVGLGGGSAMISGIELMKSGPKQNISRVVAFKLGGTVTLPPAPSMERELNPPPLKADAATVAKGGALYGGNCSSCHGLAAIGGILPDLRYTPHLDSDTWFTVVLDGALEDNGMLGFKDRLSHDDAAAIRSYLIARAHQTKEGLTAPANRGEQGTPQ